MAPLLTRLDEQLAACADAARRAEWLAERGCHVARVGDFEGELAALGDKEAARCWYDQPRTQAGRIGDEAALGTTMLDRPTLQLIRLQTLALLDDARSIPVADLNFAALELESAGLYQAATGIGSMALALQVGRAQALILGAQHEAAQAQLQARPDSAEFPPGCRSRAATGWRPGLLAAAPGRAPCPRPSFPSMPMPRPSMRWTAPTGWSLRAAGRTSPRPGACATPRSAGRPRPRTPPRDAMAPGAGPGAPGTRGHRRP